MIEFDEPDVVIVDVQSVRGEGLSTLRKIKQLRKSIPVIAVSMADMKQYSRHSMKAGADCFFRLPEDIIKLIELFND